MQQKGRIKHKPEHFMLPETTLQDNIKQATNHLCTVQVNKERCQTWLSQLITVQADNKNPQKRAYKFHIATECQRELSRRIKAMETEEC